MTIVQSDISCVSSSYAKLLSPDFIRFQNICLLIKLCEVKRFLSGQQICACGGNICKEFVKNLVISRRLFKFNFGIDRSEFIRLVTYNFECLNVFRIDFHKLL